MQYKRIVNGNILFRGPLFSANANLENLASLVDQITYTPINPRAKDLHEEVSELSRDIADDFGFLLPKGTWITPSQFAKIIEERFSESLKVKFYCEVLNAL